MTFDPNNPDDAREWLKRTTGELSRLNRRTWESGERQLALAHARLITETCRWEEDENGIWNLCDSNTYEFYEGGPKDNGFKACSYCTHLIEEVPFKELDHASSNNTRNERKDGN